MNLFILFAILSIIQNFSSAKLISEQATLLTPIELNNLLNNPNFDENYRILEVNFDSNKTEYNK